MAGHRQRTQGWGVSDNVSRQMRGFIVVQPALEPWPSCLWSVGNWAAFVYARWSSWAVGFEILGAGAAVFIGPFMIGACLVKQQIAAFDALTPPLINGGLCDENSFVRRP